MLGYVEDGIDIVEVVLGTVDDLDEDRLNLIIALRDILNKRRLRVYDW